MSVGASLMIKITLGVVTILWYFIWSVGEWFKWNVWFCDNENNPRRGQIVKVSLKHELCWLFIIAFDRIQPQVCRGRFWKVYSRHVRGREMDKETLVLTHVCNVIYFRFHLTWLADILWIFSGQKTSNESLFLNDIHNSFFLCISGIW